MIVRFFVPGLPKPQGSKRAFAGKGGGRPILVESSKGVKSWRHDVHAAALAVRPLGWGALDERQATPVRVLAVFALPRPTSHLTAKGVTRPVAPVFPVTKPDADKLLRAVLDALTGVLWRDDSAVALAVAEKRYTKAEPGVFLEVERGLPWSTPVGAASELVERLGYIAAGAEIIGGVSAR